MALAGESRQPHVVPERCDRPAEARRSRYTVCLQTRVTAMRRRAGRGTSSANEENPERTCCIPFARLFAFAVVCEALEKT